MPNTVERALRALARQGLDVHKDGPVYSVQHRSYPGAPAARVLLPEGFRLEGKALRQLCGFAAVAHPEGGEVRRACATPDFHAGSLVPVGSVIATSPDLVVPQAIGTDIQCGMRLHVADLDLGQFMPKKERWLELVRGDLLLGTRDLPMTVEAMRAIFSEGALGWLEQVRRAPPGMLRRVDLDQLEAELERIHNLGSEVGDVHAAPIDLMPEGRKVIRDSYLGTVGGGNHFVELQIVEELLDRRCAFGWGVRTGQMALMIHSGSRRVGAFVGGEWIARARERWPRDIPAPSSGIFSLQGELARSYLAAMRAAANYANVNRLLLAEIVRDRTRELFGRELAMPLIFDVPHNTISEEDGLLVHRKGATPAHAAQPVLVPGSMGQASYLMVGEGNAEYLSSASHGAGRALTRTAMHRKARLGADLGLSRVECITLKQERLIQEAPLAYNAIEPVVDVQAKVGIARPVARLRPLVTFKA